MDSDFIYFILTLINNIDIVNKKRNLELIVDLYNLDRELFYMINQIQLFYNFQFTIFMMN